GAVGEQTALELGIGPGFGNDARAVVRADLGLIGLDDEIERLGVDIALFAQNGLERAHPQLHLAKLRAVMIVVMIVVVATHTLKSSRPVVPCLPVRRWPPHGCHASIAAQQQRRQGDPRMDCRIGIAAALAATTLVTSASAQTFPERPIEVTVPFS